MLHDPLTTAGDVGQPADCGMKKDSNNGHGVCERGRARGRDGYYVDRAIEGTVGPPIHVQLYAPRTYPHIRTTLMGKLFTKNKPGPSFHRSGRMLKDLARATAVGSPDNVQKYTENFQGTKYFISRATAS